jgi:hypothetical protein
VLSDDAVDFIGQEDKVSQGNASFKMPLGMWNEGIAPSFTWYQCNKIFAFVTNVTNLIDCFFRFIATFLPSFLDTKKRSVLSHKY